MASLLRHGICESNRNLLLRGIGHDHLRNWIFIQTYCIARKKIKYLLIKIVVISNIQKRLAKSVISTEIYANRQ